MWLVLSPGNIRVQRGKYVTSDKRVKSQLEILLNECDLYRVYKSQ